MADEQVTQVPPRSSRCWTALSSAPLDAQVAASWVTLPSCGAVVTFCGTARDHAGTRTGVTLLEYEAYDEQVVPVLDRIADAACARFPSIGRLAIWHRTGPLAVTDVAVVVSVSTPHRQEAFDAARWTIDSVKAQAPIWKREHHDGGADWAAAHESALPGAVAS
jgi:molybdopterin synthase catalytic subunit